MVLGLAASSTHAITKNGVTAAYHAAMTHEQEMTAMHQEENAVPRVEGTFLGLVAAHHAAATKNGVTAAHHAAITHEQEMTAMYHPAATQQITKQNGMIAMHHAPVTNDHTKEDGVVHQTNDQGTTKESGMIAVHHAPGIHDRKTTADLLGTPSLLTPLARKEGGEEEDANKQMRNE